MKSGSRLCFFNGGVITACWKFAGTDPDSSDMLMIVANIESGSMPAISYNHQHVTRVGVRASKLPTCCDYTSIEET